MLKADEIAKRYLQFSSLNKQTTVFYNNKYHLFYRQMLLIFIQDRNDFSLNPSG